MEFEKIRFDPDLINFIPKLIPKLNECGLIILTNFNEDSMLRLSNQLGKIEFHIDADKRGVTRIVSDTSNFYHSHEGQSEQPLHTDASSLEKPAEFLITSCVQESRFGGDSLFCDGKLVFEEIREKYPDLLHKLCISNCTFGPDDRNKIKSSIFYQESGFHKIRFRDDGFLFYSSDITLEDQNKLFKVMNKYTSSFKLENNEGYLILNSRILHGRKAYSGERDLRRVLVYANRRKFPNLNLGFISN